MFLRRLLILSIAISHTSIAICSDSQHSFSQSDKSSKVKRSLSRGKKIIVLKPHITDYQILQLINSAQTEEDYYLLGEAFRMKGNDDDAQTFYLKSIYKNPSFEKPYRRLAKQYSMSGKTSEAVKLYEKFLQNNEGTSDLLTELAMLYFEQKDFKTSEHYLEKALKKDAENTQAHFYRARVAEYNDRALRYGPGFDYVRAITEYQKCLELDPYNREAIKNLGFVYSCMNKDNLAQEQFTKLIKLGRELPSFYYDLGLLYCQVGKIKEAAIEFNKVLEHDPRNIAALYNLAILQIELGDYRVAANTFHSILEIDPDNLDSVYNLAITYDKYLKNAKKASEYYRRYLLKNKVLDSQSKAALRKRIAELSHK